MVFARRVAAVARTLLFLMLTLCSIEALAQETAITRYARFTGNLNFVATGGSLRAESNFGDACELDESSTQALSGIPAGATIQAAYLYWGGSGSAGDSTVRLNGTTVAADRAFQATFFNGGTPLPFFGRFADVTGIIGGNGNITFRDLAVDTGSAHCEVAAVLAGWGLIVVYGSPSERLRAINIFDGLQFFRGDSLSLTPDGFRIPTSNIDGRMAIVAWEGDPGNSDPLNGSAERLSFNGSPLNDAINVPGSDPTNQPFDGTVNSQGADDSYGVDVDTFDVSGLLSPGQISATTVFSAGADLVLLTAQVVSVTSEPVVDLSIAKSHTGDFTVGTNGTYTITVSNAPGSQTTDFPIVVTDSLPAGLSFVSGAGTGWSCSASGQDVTCTHAGPLVAGASLPNLALQVSVDAAAFPAVTNTAEVTTPSDDPDASNNVASDPTTVLGPDLSTSTKTVQDLNGGDAEPGDTLRYTITIAESAGVAAAGVAITDDIPANVAGFAVTAALPPGATNASTFDGTGANGTGHLDISNIGVPANGSVAIVFDVQVAASAAPGSTIDNTAMILNPAGTDVAPAAPRVIVAESQIPGSGTKPLYLLSEPGRSLSRTPPSSSQDEVEIDSEGDSATWTMTPVLQTPLTLQAGNFAVRLWLTRSGGGGFFSSFRQVSVTLVNSVLGPIDSATNWITPSGGTPEQFDFVLDLPNSITAPAGSTFSLVVSNDTWQNNRGINVHPTSGGNVSRVELQSATVINVDSVQTFDGAYPGGTLLSDASRGSTVYVRAVVSDPFGSFDITGANISILDPASTTVVNNVGMTQVDDSGSSTRTYELAFLVPPDAPVGAWTTRVVAREGTENTITDVGLGTFEVSMPQIQVQKLSEVLSDPINGNVDPKRIPGSIQRYSITVSNAGAGTVDADSLVISDVIPTGISVFVSTAGADPIELEDGPVASGLSLDYATNVSFSNRAGGGAPFDYTPSPDASGFDSAVTGVRIAPSGTMLGASGANIPSFTIRFVVRLD